MDANPRRLFPVICPPAIQLVTKCGEFIDQRLVALVCPKPTNWMTPAPQHIRTAAAEDTR
jgi:hypothetical protein